MFEYLSNLINQDYFLPRPKPPPGSNLATCCLNALLTALSNCAQDVAAPTLVCAIAISPVAFILSPSFP